MTAEPVTGARFVYDAATAVDPLGDAEREGDKATLYNRAKVGSGSPSSLLYTYGPGAIMLGRRTRRTQLGSRRAVMRLLSPPGTSEVPVQAGIVEQVAPDPGDARYRLLEGG